MQTSTDALERLQMHLERAEILGSSLALLEGKVKGRRQVELSKILHPRIRDQQSSVRLPTPAPDELVELYQPLQRSPRSHCSVGTASANLRPRTCSADLLEDQSGRAVPVAEIVGRFVHSLEQP